MHIFTRMIIGYIHCTEAPPNKPNTFQRVNHCQLSEGQRAVHFCSKNNIIHCVELPHRVLMKVLVSDNPPNHIGDVKARPPLLFTPYQEHYMETFVHSA